MVNGIPNETLMIDSSFHSFNSSSIGTTTKHTTNPRTKKSGTFFSVPDFLGREKLRVNGTKRDFDD